jgi:hypothetical protein
MDKTLDYAALERRVARADARDKYRATVRRAREQLQRDYARADAGWIVVANRVRHAALRRRAIRARLRTVDVAMLHREHQQLTYMLKPEYAVYTDPEQRADVKILLGMITTELARRTQTQEVQS